MSAQNFTSLIYIIMVYIQVISYRLVGPDFVWLIPGWLRTNQWAAVDSTGCTADEISKALEHSLGGRGNSVVDNDPTRMLVSYKVCLIVKVYKLHSLYIHTECETVQTRVRF